MDQDWSRIEVGLQQDCSRIGLGLVQVWSRIGVGLEQDWSRICLGFSQTKVSGNDQMSLANDHKYYKYIGICLQFPSFNKS